MKHEFNDILNDCLERLLKGDGLEQCLSRYPDHADELEPLLRTSLMARCAASVSPSAEFRTRARRDFQRALAEVRPAKTGWSFGWQPRWATALVACLVLFLVIGSSTVAAARNSLPDQPLYQVKLAAENVRVTFTTSKIKKAELYAELADKRIKEIAVMADQGKRQEVEMVAGLLRASLMNVAMTVAEEAPEPAEAGVLMVPAPAPAPTAVPAPTQAPAPRITIPPPVIAAVPAPITQAPPAITPGAPRAAAVQPGEGEPGDRSAEAKIQNGPAELASDSKIARNGTDKEKLAKLKINLLRHARENPETLRELLQNSPPAMRAALLKAIAAADDGYREALKHLKD
ncbi:MAG: hypothetical protein HYX96_02825 [Chloroflexi bacterium]|nr:hypothetical protein [Chloroflexota bacterium]